jgi:hypothetical protein
MLNLFWYEHTDRTHLSVKLNYIIEFIDVLKDSIVIPLRAYDVLRTEQAGPQEIFSPILRKYIYRPLGEAYCVTVFVHCLRL